MVHKTRNQTGIDPTSSELWASALFFCVLTELMLSILQSLMALDNLLLELEKRLVLAIVRISRRPPLSRLDPKTQSLPPQL